jgi:primosomal protein N'
VTVLFEYATVYLLDVPVFLDNGYDYYIPTELRADIKRGSFVNVPFGNYNRASLAVVTELREKPIAEEISCKPITSLCNGKLCLCDEHIGLCFFMKEQTLCTFGEAVRATVPASVISRLEEIYFIAEDAAKNPKALERETLPVCEYIRKKGSVSFDCLKNKFGPATEIILKRLRDIGAVVKSYEIKDREAKTENCYTLSIPRADADRIIAATDTKYRLRSPMHVEIVRVLSLCQEEMREDELMSKSGASKAQIKAVRD